MPALNACDQRRAWRRPPRSSLRVAPARRRCQSRRRASENLHTPVVPRFAKRDQDDQQSEEHHDGNRDRCIEPTQYTKGLMGQSRDAARKSFTRKVAASSGWSIT